MKLYTIGYAGRSLDDFLAALPDDFRLLDVRLSANSRVATWRKASLEEIFGARYTHAPDLGNANYRGGPIALVNPEPWINRLELELRWSDNQPIVLMCVCRDWRVCHRALIVEMLIARIPELEVEHL